jgi:hypothetical protein
MRGIGDSSGTGFPYTPLHPEDTDGLFPVRSGIRLKFMFFPRGNVLFSKQRFLLIVTKRNIISHEEKRRHVG